MCFPHKWFCFPPKNFFIRIVSMVEVRYPWCEFSLLCCPRSNHRYYFSIYGLTVSRLLVNRTVHVYTCVCVNRPNILKYKLIEQQFPMDALIRTGIN